MAACNFPQSSDGDIEILLSSDLKDKLILHSHTLSLHSPWFKASVSERWNGGDVTSTSVFGSGAGGREGGSRAYWVYELRFEPGSALGVLTHKNGSNSTANTEVISAQAPLTPPALALRAERLACVKAHRNLFSIPYWADLELDDGDLDKTISSIKMLGNVAEIYTCAHLPKRDVEIQLSKFRDEVLDRCTTDPLGMLELASAVKVGWVFMDAATVVITSDCTEYRRMQPKLVELGLADLIAKKRAGVTWGNAIAVSFFHDWLAEQLNAGQGSKLQPGYARLYHDIMAQGFHGHSPSCVHNLSLFCKKIQCDPGVGALMDDLLRDANNVFAVATQIAGPVLDSTRRLHNSKIALNPFQALSCISVTEEELPWAKK